MLGCKHFLHFDCLRDKLLCKWVPPKISFQYLKCPACNAEIETDHSELISIIDEDRKIEAEVWEISLKEAKKEGLDKHDYSGPPFNGNLEAYAMDQIVVYQCYKCKKYYPAGMKDCRREAKKAEDLICGDWTFEIVGSTHGVDVCDLHGTDSIVYKCKFWCSLATFFCWGSTHFCTPCHNLQNAGKYLDSKPPEYFKQCSGKKEWPLKVSHPANGASEYALWWALCKAGTDS